MDRASLLPLHASLVSFYASAAPDKHSPEALPGAAWAILEHYAEAAGEARGEAAGSVDAASLSRDLLLKYPSADPFSFGIGPPPPPPPAPPPPADTNRQLESLALSALGSLRAKATRAGGFASSRLAHSLAPAASPGTGPLDAGAARAALEGALAALPSPSDPAAPERVLSDVCAPLLSSPPPAPGGPPPAGAYGLLLGLFRALNRV
ncbi:hypothetical protein TeGR_g296, partial [Tetraparma gracilis]